LYCILLYCIKWKSKTPDCVRQTVQQRTGTYGFIKVHLRTERAHEKGSIVSASDSKTIHEPKLLTLEPTKKTFSVTKKIEIKFAKRIQENKLH
jgi:hypothetical protein